MTLPARDGRDTILVTGGAGFIGSNMARALAADGWRVVVADWFGTGGKWKNLVDVGLDDIIRPETTLGWLAANHRRVEVIVHLGAISATTEPDVDLIVERNIRATLDLWAFAAENDLRLIYASSAATYGGGEAGFIDEQHADYLARLRPLNAYGWSKLATDRRIMSDVGAGRPTPPQWAGMKFFNVYGPHEAHKDDMRSVIHKIYPIAAAGETVSLFRSHDPDYEDGGQLRDFVHVDDCVAVMRWLVASPSISGIFNVGTGQARSFADLARAVFAALGQEPKIAYVDMPERIRKGYQYFTEADMSKLRARGYNADFLSLEEGVRRYVDFLRATDDAG
ncbi:ADP-glyceromanno-heptose 6-epimerase [Kaistia dalseonensis]|uniref:ADP-L-glycero-D-manno-heptose-6-epimerase n=1 Tax=Kaistia dalseonensis TaxID=410840 RepID=A0ABU0H1M7_9HYPH|nr:ADP-glyceromanno-heptose 6-epimerase [Kaistia dalseonensis]MCX5493654.1 ADP-glyceromanno-heptose 6-epimerase [Kaistia dalseonensis]MDQ0436216.1 ADP-L-glycero-D-manno-heptose 6-epimerase [Kaistia dalseonensis]